MKVEIWEEEENRKRNEEENTEGNVGEEMSGGGE